MEWGGRLCIDINNTAILRNRNNILNIGNSIIFRCASSAQIIDSNFENIFCSAKSSPLQPHSFIIYWGKFTKKRKRVLLMVHILWFPYLFKLSFVSTTHSYPSVGPRNHWKSPKVQTQFRMWLGCRVRNLWISKLSFHTLYQIIQFKAKHCLCSSSPLSSKTFICSANPLLIR